MELFAGAPLPLALAALALLDSLSIGTLLIPLFLLLSPGRVRVGRMLLYLAAIAGFYLLVGLLFLWGLVNIVDVAADFLSSPTGVIARLVVGGGLLVGSFLIPTSSKKRVSAGSRSAGSAATDSGSVATGASESAAPAEEDAAPGRLVRWRNRLLAAETARWAIVSVAIAAGTVEVATMLPYIVAMTMLADAGVDAPVRVLSLVGYCAVMVLPAIILLVLRLVAARLVRRPLERLAAWMQRTGAETTAWIIGIIGFLIARAAATELGLF